MLLINRSEVTVSKVRLYLLKSPRHGTLSALHMYTLHIATKMWKLFKNIICYTYTQLSYAIIFLLLAPRTNNNLSCQP